MRYEMLKRLDEIIATAASVIAGADCGRQAIEDDWPVLRAELVAEMCENCQFYRGDADEDDPPNNSCDLHYFARPVGPNFFCARFAVKKEPA